MNGQTQINRDPFARASLMRRKDPGPCRWCGQRGRFAYGWDEDQWHLGGVNEKRPHFEGPFCSVGCYRTFFSY